ncbi:cysteine desulfurase family protein [Blattabacterium cuenoti]|uniref:cysteine desulfurase family protein n=1 Tax=Blattabacterium cuenoti TaxID=1653831 RepID=UPI00163CEEBA|nr:cysteine desulfurase family protein [Blattabacterium cuenoti]
MKRVYLDNAATTPVKNEVLKAMIDTLKYSFGNPSSIQHSYGRESRSIIEESRISIANNIHASPSEILFTSGGTEGNNLVLRSSISDLKIKHIITSKLEHISVLRTVTYLSSNNIGISVHFINFNEKGVHDIDHLEYLLKKYSSKKTLVSLMYANNEIGNILEIDKVIPICKKYGAYFHSDAVQFIGNFPVNMKKMLFDFLTASAHKFYGPKGIGFVFIRKNILNKIKYFITGGQQEYGIRSGTENTYGIVGISEALKLSYKESFNHIDKMKKLKSYCILELKKIIPNVIFNGLSYNLYKSIPTILNFLYPIDKIDNLLYFRLDLMGISVSKGSSCDNSGDNSNKGISHVIKSITSENFLKKMMPIRISFGFFNKMKDVDLLIQSLQEIKKNIVI